MLQLQGGSEFLQAALSQNKIRRGRQGKGRGGFTDVHKDEQAEMPFKLTKIITVWKLSENPAQWKFS